MRLEDHKVGESYSDAKTHGLKYYYGKPCTKCGGTLRRLSRAGCYVCEVENKAIAQIKYMKKDPAKQLWHHAKQRARSKGIPFNISVEDVKKSWPKDDKCPILGIQMIPGFGQGRGPKVDSPTLDRKIPSKGYTKENIAVISFRANRIRQNETNPDIFRKIADWMEAI